MVCALTPIRSASSCEVIVCSGALLNWVTICKALLFIALLFLYLQTVIPLKSMQQAAKEYAAGHYDYQMPEYAGHDHTDLAGAIQYLATKMKDTNEYQKNFIANVSHDFRSPLTSIKGYTQAMADGTIPPEMQGKYLDIILFEVERLTKLTNNLLSLSEFENKGVPLEISTFDINKELKRCLATFEQRCTQKHISLDITFDAKTSLVDADQSKIEQVIQNLVDNAIKFSNDDSTIEIHTREKNQKVNGTNGTDLNFSEQTELINQTTEIQASSLEAKYTYWKKTLEKSDFKNGNYYNILLENQSNYLSYWISSRCTYSNLGCIGFGVRVIDSDILADRSLYNSANVKKSADFSFRPVVTLNSDIKIDTVNSGNGSTAEQAYVIK